MKKSLFLVMAFVFVSSLAASSYAADLPKPVDKFAKGMVEIVKSPAVLYDHTKLEMDKSSYKPLGFFKGIVESPFHLVKKAGGGAIDVVTCPIE